MKLKRKEVRVNNQLKKMESKMNPFVSRLDQIKRDIVNSLSEDKTSCFLITVPDISIRDYFLEDSLFKNFISNRVSFREKKLKNNKMMLIGIERI